MDMRTIKEILEAESSVLSQKHTHEVGLTRQSAQIQMLNWARSGDILNKIEEKIEDLDGLYRDTFDGETFRQRELLKWVKSIMLGEEEER